MLKLYPINIIAVTSTNTSTVSFGYKYTRHYKCLAIIGFWGSIRKESSMNTVSSLHGFIISIFYRQKRGKGHYLR